MANPTRKPDPAPSLMSNIGAFFGEIAKAIKTDPAAPRTIEIARTQQDQPVETELGPATATTRAVDEVAVTPAQNGKPAQVTARRTTIEEVTLPVQTVRPGAAGTPNTKPPAQP